MSDASTTLQKAAAEFIGIFVLVFFGCGTAVMSGGDYVATGLAFGLAVLVMAYAVGRITGGHFNPAVTVGAVLGGRLPWSQVGIYIGAQLVGAIAGGLSLFILLQGFEGFDAEGNMGQNAFGDASANGYAWWAAFLLETLMTLIFVWVILFVTDTRNEHPALAPLAIGLALTMIHYGSIAATGTSVNPARSIGVALFAGPDAIIQLWLFIIAPTLGGALAGLTYPLLFGHGDPPVAGSGLWFRQAPAAVPGYGAPDQYQQEWNQGDAQQPQQPQQQWPADQYQQEWNQGDQQQPPPASPTPTPEPPRAAPPQATPPPATPPPVQPPTEPPAGPPPQQSWPEDDGPDQTQIRPPGQ